MRPSRIPLYLRPASKDNKTTHICLINTPAGLKNKSHFIHHGHEEGHLRCSHRRCLRQRRRSYRRGSCRSPWPKQWSLSCLAPSWLLRWCFCLVFLCLVPLSLTWQETNKRNIEVRNASENRNRM
ncbi:hypothetical protein CR513_12395, partial [Mucuna pruriens]